MTFIEGLEIASIVVRGLNALAAPVLLGFSMYKWCTGSRELALYLAVMVIITQQNGAS